MESLTTVLGSSLGLFATIAGAMAWVNGKIREAILSEREISAMNFAPRLTFIELQGEMRATREAIAALNERLERVLGRSL